MKENFQQEILQSRLEIQEQTFNSISQEIHDNVGQVLSLAKVQLNIIDQKEKFDQPVLYDVKENISKALTDLRDIAKSLSTERIQNLSLHDTVSQEVQRINRSGFINIVINIKGDEHKLEEQKKLILFRIIQESIQNIIKHAKASLVEILFNYADTQLIISVIDNGAGFDASAKLEQGTGLGLQNIINRAALIGGIADINSTLNKGTIIKISVPYA